MNSFHLPIANFSIRSFWLFDYKADTCCLSLLRFTFCFSWCSSSILLSWISSTTYFWRSVCRWALVMIDNYSWEISRLLKFTRPSKKDLISTFVVTESERPLICNKTLLSGESLQLFISIHTHVNIVAKKIEMMHWGLIIRDCRYNETRAAWGTHMGEWSWGSPSLFSNNEHV